MNNVGKQSFDFEKVSNFFNLTLLRMLLRFREMIEMNLISHDNISDLNTYKSAISQKQKDLLAIRRNKSQDKYDDKADQQDRFPSLATRLSSQTLEELE